MKRFLILFILITFSVVSCAGPKVVPNQVGKRLFTKPDFSQDEYEKDREECNRSIDENLDPHALHWQAFVDCLAKRGYTETQTSQDVEKTKEEPTTIKKAEEPPSGNKVSATAGAIALLIVLSPLIVAYGVLLIGSAP